MAIKYFISHKDNSITIFEIQENQLVVLKKDGEESHLYNDKDFWSWWEHKTVYKNEEVVINNNEDEGKLPKDEDDEGGDREDEHDHDSDHDIPDSIEY